MLLITNLHAFEKLVNTALMMDTKTIERIAELNGKIIRLEIQKWRTNLYVIPNQQGITLAHQLEEAEDVLISGTPEDLFRVARAKGDSAALFENQVEISGDIQTGETLRDIFRNIDIDWEYQLSGYVGEAVAYQLIRFGEGIERSRKRFHNLINSKAKTFLQPETSTLPTTKEFVAFCDSVSELRNAVDRLEARIRRLHA